MALQRKGIVVALATVGLAGLASAGIAAGAAWGATPATPTPAASTGYHNGRGMAGMHAMMAGQRTCLDAAATYLGLSPTDLQTQLRAGTSLADVAKAKGKSVSGLEDAMLAAAQRSLDADTTLSAEQKTTMLSRMKSQIDTMVTATHRGSGMGMGAGGGMMGGSMHGMR